MANPITESMLLENINKPDQLYPILVELAKMVGERYEKYDFEFEDSVFEESAKMVLPKASRYNNDKGKALNFFATCLGCCLTQFRRKEHNKELLKKKFKDYVQKQKNLHT